MSKEFKFWEKYLLLDPYKTQIYGTSKESKQPTSKGRGVSLSFSIADEFAFMKEFINEYKEIKEVKKIVVSKKIKI
jgi:hypothetical protein